MEPDGPDSTWAPEGPAWVRALQLRNHHWIPGALPLPCGGRRPRASGHFSPFALSAPPAERLASLDTHKAGESTLDCPASHHLCRREQVSLPLWDKFPVLGNGSSDSSLWSCCED